MHQFDVSPRDDDCALLARIAGGDQLALAALYGRHRDSLFAYCWWLMSERESAEELFQDTLIAVWQGAGGYAGRATVLAWMLGIVRRQAHNARRRSRLSFAGGDVPETLASAEPGPEEATLDLAACAEIAEAIKTLSPLHQEVVRLTFIHGLSYAELAETLGVPDGTVKSRLNAARRTLRAALNRRKEPR